MTRLHDRAQASFGNREAWSFPRWAVPAVLLAAVTLLAATPGQAQLQATCALTLARGGSGASCGGWYEIQFEAMNATDPITAEILALDAEGNVLGSLPVENGDLLHATSALGTFNLDSHKAGHQVVAPIPMLRVTASDGFQQARAYCSTLPFADVVQPEGGIVVSSQGAPVSVTVALPLVDPASLGLDIDGVDLLAGLGIDPATDFPGGPFAGSVMIDGRDVEVSRLVLESAGPGIPSSNTLRMQVAGLPGGGHLLNVSGEPREGLIPDPRSRQCLLDDLQESLSVASFEILIDTPLAGELVAEVPTPVRGEVRHGLAIAGLAINGLAHDVSGQTQVPGGGGAPTFVLPIDVLVEQTDLLAEVQGRVTSPGTFDAGSNRLLVQAQDLQGNRAFASHLFAVGDVLPGARSAPFARQSSAVIVPSFHQGAQVQDALAVGFTAEAVEAIFMEDCGRKLCLYPTVSPTGGTAGCNPAPGEPTTCDVPYCLGPTSSSPPSSCQVVTEATDCPAGEICVQGQCRSVGAECGCPAGESCIQLVDADGNPSPQCFETCLGGTCQGSGAACGAAVCGGEEECRSSRTCWHGLCMRKGENCDDDCGVNAGGQPLGSCVSQYEPMVDQQFRDWLRGEVKGLQDNTQGWCLGDPVLDSMGMPVTCDHALAAVDLVDAGCQEGEACIKGDDEGGICPGDDPPMGVCHSRGAACSNHKDCGDDTDTEEILEGTCVGASSLKRSQDVTAFCDPVFFPRDSDGGGNYTTTGVSFRGDVECAVEFSDEGEMRTEFTLPPFRPRIWIDGFCDGRGHTITIASYIDVSIAGGSICTSLDQEQFLTLVQNRPAEPLITFNIDEDDINITKDPDPVIHGTGTASELFLVLTGIALIGLGLVFFFSGGALVGAVIGGTVLAFGVVVLVKVHNAYNSSLPDVSSGGIARSFPRDLGGMGLDEETLAVENLSFAFSPEAVEIDDDGVTVRVDAGFEPVESSCELPTVGTQGVCQGFPYSTCETDADCPPHTSVAASLADPPLAPLGQADVGFSISDDLVNTILARKTDNGDFRTPLDVGPCDRSGAEPGEPGVCEQFRARTCRNDDGCKAVCAAQPLRDLVPGETLEDCSGLGEIGDAERTLCEIKVGDDLDPATPACNVDDVLTRVICESLRDNWNITLDTPVLFCPHVENPPRVLLRDDFDKDDNRIDTPDRVEVDLRLNDARIFVLLDRDGSSDCDLEARRCKQFPDKTCSRNADCAFQTARHVPCEIPPDGLVKTCKGLSPPRLCATDADCEVLTLSELPACPSDTSKLATPLEDKDVDCRLVEQCQDLTVTAAELRLDGRRCLGPPGTEPCQDNSDCRADQICDDPNSTDVDTTRFCRFEYEACVDSRCLGPAGGDCSDDGDCDVPGTVCRGQLCRTVGEICDPDNPSCESGEVCEVPGCAADEGPRFPVVCDDKDLGLEFTLAEGTALLERRCLGEPGATCSDATDCMAGQQCVGTVCRSVGVACEVDDDCPAVPADPDPDNPHDLCHFLRDPGFVCDGPGLISESRIDAAVLDAIEDYSFRLGFGRLVQPKGLDLGGKGLLTQPRLVGLPTSVAERGFDDYMCLVGDFELNEPNIPDFPTSGCSEPKPPNQGCGAICKPCTVFICIDGEWVADEIIWGDECN